MLITSIFPMSATIHNISDWSELPSSWKRDISVELLQQKTSSNIILSLLWINSMSPDKMVEFLATQRKIVEALQNSNNQIMQHIPERDWVEQEEKPRLAA